MTAVQREVQVSIVVPVYNNAATLDELCTRLAAALDPEAEAFEILLVDDGSRDASWDTILRLAQRNSRIRPVRLARNFGQAAALCAGFDQTRGEIVVTIDADLQNFPEDVPQLIAEIRKGHDLASGVRVTRKDPRFARRLPSLLTNWMVRYVTGIPLTDVGCGLNALRRRIVVSISQSGDMRRFLKPLAATLSDSMSEIPVRHGPSPSGRSGYTFMDLLSLQLDLFTSFSRKPFQRIGIVGVLLLLVGFLGSLVHVGLLVVTGSTLGLRAQALLILAMIFGLQLAVLGMLGEFIVRIFHAQSRPFYVVRDEAPERE